MKINDKVKAIAKYWLHGVLIAETPLILAGETTPKYFIAAAIGGGLLPALVASDKNNASLGRVAAAIEAELPVSPKLKP